LWASGFCTIVGSIQITEAVCVGEAQTKIGLVAAGSSAHFL